MYVDVNMPNMRIVSSGAFRFGISTLFVWQDGEHRPSRMLMTPQLEGGHLPRRTHCSLQAVVVDTVHE